MFLAHFPCKNSRERKSGKTFEDPLINSISKSKTDKIACHLAKICFETKFEHLFAKFLLHFYNQFLKEIFC